MTQPEEAERREHDQDRERRHGETFWDISSEDLREFEKQVYGTTTTPASAGVLETNHGGRP